MPVQKFFADGQYNPNGHSITPLSDYYRLAPQPAGAFGIEVEVENCNVDFGGDPRYALWHVTEDGSLRNTGREFVSRVLVPAKLDTAINQLSRVFNEIAPATTPSYRCGIHIHYNQTNRNGIQVVEFVLAAIAMERLFLKAFSPERCESVYCVPWQDGRGIHRELRRSLASYYDVIELLSAHTSKYTTVNVLPLRQYGTVEFRMFPSTTQATAIKSYLKAIQNLDDMVTSIGLKGIMNHLEQGNYKALVDGILLDVDPHVVVCDEQELCASLVTAFDFINECVV